MSVKGPQRLCCENCFDDTFLKDHVKEEGKPGRCDFCRRSSHHCIEPEELHGLFEPVLKLYERIEEFMPLEDLKVWDGDFIWDKLQEEWGIFSDKVDRGELLKSIVNIHYDKETGPTIFDSFVEIESEYWGDEPNLNEDWRIFCAELIYQNRFFPIKKIDVQVVKEILPLCKQKIDQGTFLYRARISAGNKAFPLDKMGKPPIEQTKDGRANPKGIPYLYLASDVGTAIAEVRPSIGYYLTVAKFENNLAIEVIDLRNPSIQSPFMYGDRIGEVLEHLSFLELLGHELSKPIKVEESELLYIPSQYLCELIKSSQYTGVIYKSAISKGFNLALFDDSVVECIEADLYEINSVDYGHRKIPRM